MIRRHENSVSFKAGVLAIGVHAALLIALLVSVNWKTTHTASVAEVELWDRLPSPQVQKPIPRPEPKVEPPPKPEPPKVEKVEPPEPKIEPKADITVKKLEKKIEKKVEKPKEKKPDALAALQKELMQDELEKDKKQKKDDALKKLQQEALADEKADSDQQVKASKSAASASVIGEYSDKIRAKVQRNVNKTLCSDGKPKLVFEITVMPTGDVQGTPKLLQSSKSSACDDAVERAILQSQPLPLPADASLREQFRNLRLEFHPND